MKCTKKRDARAELLFCLFNQLLLYPEYSSRIRNRTRSHLESRIQVPLTKTGIRSPRRGIQNPGLSWIPLHGAINLIKKKRRTIAIKEHKIGKPNEKGNICERNWAECNGQAKTTMRKCIFTCVNKTLLFTHQKLPAHSGWLFSCELWQLIGSYVYLLLIS